MTIDVTSLAIAVTTTGITEAAKALDGLVTSAKDAEKAFPGLKVAAEALSASQKSGADQIEKLLAKLQKQVVLLGANEEATASYNAEMARGNTVQVALAASLGASVDAYKQNELAQKRQVESAIATAKANKDLDDSYKKLEAEARAYYDTLAKNQAKGNALNEAGQRANDYKKLTDAQRALTQQTKELAAAESALAKAQVSAIIEDQSRSYKNLASAQKEAIKMNKEWDAGIALNKSGMAEHTQNLERAKKGHGDLNLVTAGSTREFIVLGHEMMTGNFSRFWGSLVVLSERINFLPKALAAGNEAAAAFGVSLGVLVGVIASVVVAIGLASYSYYKSWEALHDLNKEVILTGHYAGQTGQNLYDMERAVGSLTGRFGDARKAFSELTATGKFTSDQINTIATAATALSANGGPAIDVVIKQFEKLAAEPMKGAEKGFNGISKAAVELDAQLHFLAPSVLSEIMHLENIGDVAGASQLAINALATEEKKRAKELGDNLSELGRIANANIWFFSTMWESLFHVPSNTEQLAGLKSKLADLQVLTGVHPENNHQATLIKAIAELQIKVDKEVNDSNTKLNKDILDRAANLALVQRDRLLDRTRGENALQDALIRNAQQEQAAHDAGLKSDLFSDQANHDARLKIVKDFAEKKKAIPGIGLAGLNEEIKALDLQLTQQENVYDAELRLLERQHKNKQVSDLVYFADKEDLLKKELKNVEDIYDKEIKAATNFHSTNSRLMLDAAIKKQELQKKLDTAQTHINEKIDANYSDEIKAANASQVAAEKAYTTTVKNLEKEIKTLEDKNNAYRDLPESIRQAGITQKQYADLVTQSAIDRLETDKLEDTLGDKDIARLNEQIRLLKEKRDLQKINETDTAFNVAALKQTAAAETAWKDADKRIGDGLYNAIAKSGGDAFKKLLLDVKEWFAHLILSPIIAPIAAFGASLLNPSAASAQGTVGGSTGGAIGAAQTAYGVYNTLQKGFDGIGTSVADGVQAGLNAVGLSDKIASNGAFANGVGDVASSLSAYFAGSKLNSAISGQYQTGSGVMKVETLATAIASAFNPVLGPIVGAVSGLVNRLFGMGATTVTHQGLDGYVGVNGSSIEGTMTTNTPGGLFRSDDNKTTYTRSADVLNTFNNALAVVKTTSTNVATQLGLSTTSLENYSKAFDITITSEHQRAAEAANKSSSEIQAAIQQDNAENQKVITEFFVTIADDMATKLVPNISDFARVGETASVTFQRLSDTFTATNAIADILGKTSAEAFGSTSLSSDKARERLVDLAGGIQALATQTTFYTSNFLTDAEKLAPVQSAVTKAMNELGEGSITTKDQFKQLVNGLDLTDAAQAQTFASLMKLAPAFAAVADATEKFNTTKRGLEIELLNAQGKTIEATAATRADELAALQKTYPELVKNKQAVYDAAGALATSNKLHDLNITLLEAEGKTTEATTAKRKDELAALALINPALVATQKAIYAATEALAASNKQHELSISLLEAEGKTSEATFQQRLDTLAALAKINPALVSTQILIYTTADALAISNKQRELDIALMTAEGDTLGALSATREDTITALAKIDKGLAETQRNIYAAADALAITNKQHELEITLLDALGKTALATSYKREDELAALEKLSPSLVLTQQAIYAVTDATTFATNANKNLVDQHKLEADILKTSGDELAGLAITRKDEIAALELQDHQLALTQDALNKVTDAMKLAKDTADALTKAQQDQSTAASDLKSATESANSSLQQISSTMASLHDAVGAAMEKVASAQDAIRQAYFSAQDEAVAAQQNVASITQKANDSLKSFSLSIKDFLTSLNTTTLGSGNPTTQLAALKDQFNSTASAAIRGDVDAQGKLVGIAQNLLAASKTYNGSGAGFVADEAMVKNVMSGFQSLADSGGIVIKMTPEMTTALDTLAKAQEKVLRLGYLAQDTFTSIDNRATGIDATIKALRDAYLQANIVQANATTQYLDGLTITRGIALAVQNANDGLAANVASYKKSLDDVIAATKKLADATDAVTQAQFAAKAAADAAKATVEDAKAVAASATDLVTQTASSAAQMINAANSIAAAAQAVANAAQHSSVLAPIVTPPAPVVPPVVVPPVAVNKDGTPAKPAIPASITSDNSAPNVADNLAYIQKIQDEQNAIAAAQAKAQADYAAKQTMSNSLTQAYQAVLGRAPDASGAAYWSGVFSSGNITDLATQEKIIAQGGAALKVTDRASYSDVNAANNWLSSHPDGSHAGGLDRVPFDNYKALLHVGERVQTAKAVKAQEKGNEELVDLTEQLLERISKLEAHAGAANVQRAAVAEQQEEKMTEMVTAQKETTRKVAALT